MQTTHDIAIFQANTTPIDGLDVFWVLSKKQLEYVLQDITAVSTHPRNQDLQRAQYQDDMLTVLSLEKYYGLEELPGKVPFKYLVAKSASDGKILRTIVRTMHPVRIRSLDFTATEIHQTGLSEHQDDILGAYNLPENQLLIIPDIPTIMDTLV